MPDAERLVELRGIVKDYRGLRPLRVRELDLHAGQSIALLGFDQTTAELLVNMVTGAILPDTGEVRALGQLTSGIASADAWIHTLDQFGLISERAVLLEQLTVEQNLAVPLSLELDELSVVVRAQVKQLADEVGISTEELRQAVGAIGPAARIRLRLGRALALNPRVLLAEHPNALLSPQELPAFAADLSRIVAARGLASIVITADQTFAHAVAEQVLTLQPATGELKRAAGWRRWFS